MSDEPRTLRGKGRSMTTSKQETMLGREINKSTERIPPVMLQRAFVHMKAERECGTFAPVKRRGSSQNFRLLTLFEVGRDVREISLLDTPQLGSPCSVGTRLYRPMIPRRVLSFLPHAHENLSDV
jgi:hypothetical protein